MRPPTRTVGTTNKGHPAMSAIDEIAVERKRQIEIEGWTLEHDDEHKGGEMVLAAISYAFAGQLKVSAAIARQDVDDGLAPRHEWGQHWPWALECWKPKDQRRNLIRAAALIVAEIERMDRQS